MMIYEIY